MTEHGIQWYLQQWGIWQRIAKNPIPRYVSPAYAILAQNVEQQRSAPACMIDDDTALGVDAKVCALSRRNPMRETIIQLYYRIGMSDERIAEAVGISRMTALKERQCAEAWLDAIMYAGAA